MKAVPFIAIFAIGSLVGMFAMRTMVEIDAPPESPENRHESAVPVPATMDEEHTGEPAPAIADVADPEEQDILVRAIEAVEPVDLGDRSGRIHGRVTLFDGSPLPGVEITATPSRRSDREEAETLEAKVRRFIRDERWRTGLESKGTTGSEGSFLLEGIADLDYSVTAKLAGYSFESRGRRSVRPGQQVDFIATAVARLDISVVRADGSEPESAQVLFERGNGSTTRQWTPKERILDAEPGLVKVSAIGKDGERSEPVEITTEAGAPPVPLRLAMRSRGSIRGEVIFPADELETHVTVYLLPAALKPNATPEDVIQSDRNTWSSRGQTFQFEDLDPGSYWVGVSRGYQHQGGTGTPTVELVEVADSRVEVALELMPISLEEGIVVVVYAPNGTVVNDAQLSYGMVHDNGSSWGGGMSTRLRDGSVLLIPDANIANAERIQAGARCFVRAHHNSYGEQRVPVDSPRGGRVEIRYQDPATAVISVAGYVGSAAVGRIQIDLQPDDGSNEMHHYWNHDEKGIDANGELRLGPFTPGPHILRMSYIDRASGYWSSGPFLEQPVHLVAGENRLSTAVPPLYALEVVFPDAGASGSLQVSPDAEGSRGSRHTNFSEGAARIEGLVAGRYRVQAWGQGIKNGTAFVDVPASGPLHFEPAPINALRIQVTDETGPLAEAGFQSGDMIVAINGQPFEGEEQLAIMGAFLQGASEVKVTIDRGGEELEFTVDPRKLMGGNPGGSVDPTVR